MAEIDQATVSEALRELLVRHGLHCAMEQDWVVPNGELPAIRASWHPGAAAGRLDVQVLLSKGRVIEECFAGIGTGQPAFADAFNNFMINSLHVLLSSLWEVSDDKRIVREQWNVSGREFTASIGNIGARMSAGLQVTCPDGLIEVVQSRICEEDLHGDTHWFRVFFCSIAGKHTYEALKDNEPWEAGVAALQGMAWPQTEAYYSFRNFIMLRGE